MTEEQKMLLHDCLWYVPAHKAQSLLTKYGWTITYESDLFLTYPPQMCVEVRKGDVTIQAFGRTHEAAVARALQYVLEWE